MTRDWLRLRTVNKNKFFPCHSARLALPFNKDRRRLGQAEQKNTFLFCHSARLALPFNKDRRRLGQAKQKNTFFFCLPLALHYLCIKQVMNWLLDVFDD